VHEQDYKIEITPRGNNGELPFKKIEFESGNGQTMTFHSRARKFNFVRSGQNVHRPSNI